MKLNKFKCIRFVLVWVCILLFFYLYDLHFSRLFVGIASDQVSQKYNIYEMNSPENVVDKTNVDGKLTENKENVEEDVQLYEDQLEMMKDGKRSKDQYFLKSLTETEVKNADHANLSTSSTHSAPSPSISSNSSQPDLMEHYSHESRDQPTDIQSNTLTEAQLSSYHKLGKQHWTIKYMGKYPSKLYSPPPGEIPRQRFPKAIIIGAGKCGTRALLEFLTMHPYVVTAKSEVHFFDLDENFQKGLLWYKSQMPLSFSNQVTLEKTPSYMWSERAAQEIYKLNKNMKLILIVKDPVVRVISQAIRSSPQSPESIFIEEQAGILKVANESHTVDWGVYAKYIKMWLKLFPLSQLHIVESSEFINNPASEIQRLEKFLGVPKMITDKNFFYNKSKGFYCERPFHLKTIVCLSSGKGMPHPKINPILERLLYKYYSSFNEELFQLLGRKFNWNPKS